ncbi:hypothetical protein [Curtobacterium sp. MCBD17_008]|uniref:hypothetical protein n=1 Tax=Curtobacterium sp. MCBD17_008 TaxID=2175656 RepID=UPI0021AC97A4|nr:hypothetical protein [Curtobacterium sp. MCBD17_008]
MHLGRERAKADKVEHFIRNLDRRISERNTYGHAHGTSPLRAVTHRPLPARGRASLLCTRARTAGTVATPLPGSHHPGTRRAVRGPLLLRVRRLPC